MPGQHRVLVLSVLVGAALGFAPAAVAGQTRETRPAPSVAITVGGAAFVDDVPIGHTMVGGALQFPLTPRVSGGPEIQYLIGPGRDRDVIATANLTVDLLPPTRRVVPFLVAGGGLFRHSNTFDGRAFSSTEPAFTGGAGLRVRVSERIYAATELRLGWEPHYRISGTVGIALE
jgi:hypothetical protein